MGRTKCESSRPRRWYNNLHPRHAVPTPKFKMRQFSTEKERGWRKAGEIPSFLGNYSECRPSIDQVSPSWPLTRIDRFGHIWRLTSLALLQFSYFLLFFFFSSSSHRNSKCVGRPPTNLVNALRVQKHMPLLSWHRPVQLSLSLFLALRIVIWKMMLISRLYSLHRLVLGGRALHNGFVSNNNAAKTNLKYKIKNNLH